MLILAGVSINAIVGENGVLSRAQYTSFMSEMTAVEEAIQLWKVGELIDSKGNENKEIPVNGLCKKTDLDIAERLSAEIGYYRLWNSKKTMPTKVGVLSLDFNEEYGNELVFYPAGVQDLYYLNNEELGLDEKKVYLMDASTGIVYSANGANLNGVKCYSTHMAKAVMGNNVAPLFAEAEVSGTSDGEKLAGNIQDEFILDENGNKIENSNYIPYGFEIIADSQNDNIYKLYNNGELYAKGKKGNLLNTSLEDREGINARIWTELKLPSGINKEDCNQIIPGTHCVYIIDNQGYLWAYGENLKNKFGLTQEQQIEYTGRDAIKLNVDGKQVCKVFPTQNSTYALTNTNGVYELYAAGYNVCGNLGIGNKESINKFEKCVGIANPENIVSIESSYNPVRATLYLCKTNNSDYEVYFSGENDNGKGKVFLKGNIGTESLKIVRIFDGNIGEDIDQNIKQIKFFQGHSFIILTKDNELLRGIDLNKYTATTFNEESDDVASNILRISGSESYEYIVLERINSIGKHELWVYAYLVDDLGLGETAKWINLESYLPNNFNIEEVKSIRIGSGTIFLIMNDGKVYASGDYKYLGLGSNVSVNPNGFICLQDITSLPNINDVYYWDEQETTTPMRTMFLEGKDGEIYVTGNSIIMYQNDILEKTWTNIASNVKSFSANTQKNALAYVDKDNDLWVLGDNSLMLGIGTNEQTSIKNFIRVKDYLTGENKEIIDGKVEEVKIAQDSLTILTTEGSLYVTGITKRGSWPTNLCIGLAETVKDESGNEIEVNVYNNFVKVLDNVTYFNAKEYHHFAITNEEGTYKFWVWGYPDGGLGTGNKRYPVPYEQKDLPFDVSKVKKIVIARQVDYVITTDGKLYATGRNNTSGGINGLGVVSSIWKEFDMSNFNNEKIIDLAMCQYYTNTTVVITELGNVYAFGRNQYMGINSDSATDITYTPIKINGISNAESVVGGNNFFVITKKDGTVYGTGSNIYGILGRWLGIDRNSPNSRYKTAFEWVECPELEI